MYELTIISGRAPGTLTSITSPNVRTIVRMQMMLQRAGYPCRVWHKSRDALMLLG